MHSKFDYGSSIYVIKLYNMTHGGYHLWIECIISSWSKLCPEVRVCLCISVDCCLLSSLFHNSLRAQSLALCFTRLSNAWPLWTRMWPDLSIYLSGTNMSYCWWVLSWLYCWLGRGFLQQKYDYIFIYIIAFFHSHSLCWNRSPKEYAVFLVDSLFIWTLLHEYGMYIWVSRTLQGRSHAS